MNAPWTHRSRRWRSARRAAAALLMALAVPILVAACGGSDSDSGSAAGTAAMPSAIQVMTAAERGDLMASVTGTIEVAEEDGEQVVVATVAAEDASSVAAGQDATVSFRGDRGDQPQPGASGTPQAGESGMPAPQGSGMPQGAASGAPEGQGGFPGGSGQGGQGGVSGTVTAVETAADGSATVTITVDEDELPDDVTTGSTGFARIETEVLASDVVIIPTAAIEGSDDDATVQVMSDGQTETRGITVGRQSGDQSEVVSGLSEGENVVYTRSFDGPSGGGDGQSGMPVPQQSGSAQ